MVVEDEWAGIVVHNDTVSVDHDDGRQADGLVRAGGVEREGRDAHRNEGTRKGFNIPCWRPSACVSGKVVDGDGWRAFRALGVGRMGAPRTIRAVRREVSVFHKVSCRRLRALRTMDLLMN